MHYGAHWPAQCLPTGAFRGAGARLIMMGDGRYCAGWRGMRRPLMCPVLQRPGLEFRPERRSPGFTSPRLPGLRPVHRRRAASALPDAIVTSPLRGRCPAAARTAPIAWPGGVGPDPWTAFTACWRFRPEAVLAPAYSQKIRCTARQL